MSKDRGRKEVKKPKQPKKDKKLKEAIDYRANASE